MVVYEAEIESHYKKIVEWLKEQPRESFPFRCWEITAKQHQASLLDEDFFRKVKQSLQGVDVFVCEDEKGRIRVVAFRERRGKDFNPKEPQIALGLRAIPDQGDFEANFKFVKEAVDWATRNDFMKYHIETAVYDIPDRYLGLMERIYGDALEVIKETEVPPISTLPELKKIYRARISLLKYLEVNP